MQAAFESVQQSNGVSRHDSDMGVPQRGRLVPEPRLLFLSTYVVEPQNGKGQQPSLFAVASNGADGNSAPGSHENGQANGCLNGRSANDNVEKARITKPLAGMSKAKG